MVEKGRRQVFINATGIGVIDSEYRCTSLHQTGDQVIVTGQVGDHSQPYWLTRRPGFSTPAESDCAALHLSALVSKYPAQIKCMRDPTRGGLATVLNEIATQAGLGIVVEEQRIPVSAVVKGACDMLGMDPLYMANEGKMVIFASREGIDDLMRELLSNPLTQGATIIGEVVANHPGMVLLKTALGAKRILSTLEGEHVPRIC